MAKDAYKKADYRNLHEIRNAEASAGQPPSTEKKGRRDFWNRPIAEEHQVGGVRITGIDVPMSQLTVLMIKLAVAAVPAAIIASIIWTLAAAFLGGALVTGM
jgi:hypothetical protein